MPCSHQHCKQHIVIMFYDLFKIPSTAVNCQHEPSIYKYANKQKAISSGWYATVKKKIYSRIRFSGGKHLMSLNVFYCYEPLNTGVHPSMPCTQGYNG